ncbi:MAG: phosphoribosylanthranilate isomerase [Victivallales bacterium]|jgi:phosphoribosylanthranilate isomerase|nr:phosphoribosylanthranilate isomerase [Victivallales bacterium]
MQTAVKVKICGLTRREDVELAIELGADYLGFVLIPSSKRYVTLAQSRDLTANVPLKVKTVAVVANPSSAELNEIRDIFNIVQFHSDESSEIAQGANSWKALSSCTDSTKFDEYKVGRFVVDSAVGGSGICCDWNIAAEVAKRYKILLAGGLSPENIAEAIRAVRPWGVDVAGGVESSPGIKSKEKMVRFIKEAKK